MSLTRGLPPFRAIMAVDSVGFSRNPSSHQPELSASIPMLLGRTFERLGLTEIWERCGFPQGTGDGYLFGVGHEYAPYLVHPFLDGLQNTLEDENRRLMARDRELRLRLRVSIHLGTVPDSGVRDDGRPDAQDGIGTPTNDTFRLLDSESIKTVMKKSDPDTTLVAAIVSQRVFEDVVRAGYTSGLHPSRFEHVMAEVPGKEFAQPAWIYVPRPSRRHDSPDTAAATQKTPTSGAEGGSDNEPSPAPAQSGSGSGSSTTINGNVGNSLSGGTVFGGVQMNGGSAS